MANRVVFFDHSVVFVVLGPKIGCINITFSTTSLIKLAEKNFELILIYNLIELLKLAFVTPSPYNSTVCGGEGGGGCH